jgi:hypothetical protein
MWILDARERRGFARHHPPRKMLEARERQVGEREPVGGHDAKPLETADSAVLDRR